MESVLAPLLALQNLLLFPHMQIESSVQSHSKGVVKIIWINITYLSFLKLSSVMELSNMNIISSEFSTPHIAISKDQEFRLKTIIH